MCVCVCVHLFVITLVQIFIFMHYLGAKTPCESSTRCWGNGSLPGNKSPVSPVVIMRVSKGGRMRWHCYKLASSARGGGSGWMNASTKTLPRVGRQHFISSPESILLMQHFKHNYSWPMRCATGPNNIIEYTTKSTIKRKERPFQRITRNKKIYRMY